LHGATGSGILEFMLVDAHFHADELHGHDPEFPRRYREAGVVGLASVHDGPGLAGNQADHGRRRALPDSPSGCIPSCL
jgi:hypothetical protein